MASHDWNIKDIFWSNGMVFKLCVHSFMVHDIMAIVNQPMILFYFFFSPLCCKCEIQCHCPKFPFSATPNLFRNDLFFGLYLLHIVTINNMYKTQCNSIYIMYIFSITRVTIRISTFWQKVKEFMENNYWGTHGSLA